MCLFCVELQQEKLNVRQINRLGQELLVSGDEKHIDDYLEVVRNLSQDYNERLTQEALHDQELDDCGFDPFDDFS